jgi:hypothetical protein
MGQGLYTMLGYGVIAKDVQLFTEDGDAIHDEIIVAPLANLLATAYEAEPNFLMLPLAVDDGFLQDERKIPDLPYDALGGTVGPRKAKRIKVDESKLSGDLQAAADLARDRWAVIAEAFQQHGVTLPDAGFILIKDWD